MKISVIICAAGKGERAGFNKNKLLAPLYGEPALYHTLKKFDISEIDEVIITSSECDFKEICALASPFNFKVVLGGDTRTQSVKNALEKVSGDIVLIHDGARPFVSKELILNCIQSVKTYGSGICAVQSTDTCVYANLGVISARLDRSSLFAVQTPQGFMTEDIKSAYALAGDKVYTDDSAVYGEFIGAPRIIEGEKANIKLTFKEDFMRGYPPLNIAGGQKVGFGVACNATAKRKKVSDNYGVNAQKQNLLVGFGVDVHAFGEGDFVTLAGVKIPCDKGLIAHSDGDVIIHAVMDSLLSAAGLKDIGHYFPDTDEKFKGADSGKMLQEVVKLVKNAGYSPANLSVSVQAEKPKLAPHINKMIENLSALTGIPAENIAIAAGTCEGLGFVGQGLGICAYCLTTVN